MLTGEMTMEIRILHRQGRSIRSIGRQLQISRETVRKYLRAPDLAPGYGPREPRASKLGPFKPYLTMRIAEAAPRRLPAPVYLRELQARGYDGGISILKEWLAAQYPTLPTPAIIRFETPPGRQAQVDWTVIRRGKNKLSAFVGTLGFSRLSFVWFADNERFDALIEAHERFFDALGGVPHTILFDNIKTVLTDRDAYGPGQHRFNEGFRDFAKHHGFSPRMCAPYQAQTKGKVERFNRYLKESFVWPLEIFPNESAITVRRMAGPSAVQWRQAADPDARGAGAAVRAGKDAARRWRGLEREEGGAGDRGRARAGAGGRAARLGSLARHRLDHPAPAPAACPGGDARGAVGVQKKIAEAVAEEAGRHPGATVEVFCADEYRLGLKPVLRRVWAQRGVRPIAVGHHRFEWLHVTAFVSPATGESFWYLGTGVDKGLFQETLALFAREAGAGRDRIIILVLDGAGWHTAPLIIPEGIRLVYLPPYTPELQPAETLWVHVDEPIVNRHFATLDAVLAKRCVALTADRDLIRGQAGFHRWPNRVAAK